MSTNDHVKRSICKITRQTFDAILRIITTMGKILNDLQMSFVCSNILHKKNAAIAQQVKTQVKVDFNLSYVLIQIREIFRQLQTQY